MTHLVKAWPLVGQSVTWWNLATAAMNENEDQNNPRLIQSNGVNNDTLSGTDSSGLTLENVNFDATATTSENAFIDTFNTNLSPSGTNVSVSAVSGSGSVPSCSFPALPGL